MKKLFSVFLALALLLGLSGCAFSELMHDGDNVVDLGNGKESVKWNLVSHDNAYSTVEEAYFEFDKDSFRYYEDGVLKKEGTHRVTYYGVENTISPLHLNLNFGKDDSGFSVYDYIDCYTEDAKDDLHQFTVISEGYHVETERSGGVPVRDYHLSEMPYAFGTYVKEGATPYEYRNGKANYLGCARLDGTFVDDAGNKFYFTNNSYSSDPNSSSYTVYMRYESKANGTFVEGTIGPSYYEDFDTNERHDIALIYVMHGEWEPGAEPGTAVFADYQLIDFLFDGDDSFTFGGAAYFDEASECDYDPTHFIPGTYHKVNVD